MKFFLALTLLLPSCLCLAEETPAGKVCLHIPERGTETLIIQNACQKGDIIQLHKRLVAYLCDFDKAIVNYNGGDQYMCAFLGEKRGLRAGTNP
ncbi:MAG: hypothetical protein PHU14_15550 [Methylovulum sp.]|nr:hypothetical protein [Methylovulum sp.]